MTENIENQIYSVGFGKQEDEVIEKDFYKFIHKRKLTSYNNCMHQYYFKNGILIAYYIHGSYKNNYYIVDNNLPRIGRATFEVPLPVEYVVGFDDYKEEFTPNESLWFQLKKGKVFEYKGREESKITRRDIALTVIYMFNEYEMPYTKNKVTTEGELDAEVTHFYFLNKYDLL